MERIRWFGQPQLTAGRHVIVAAALIWGEASARAWVLDVQQSAA